MGRRPAYITCFVIYIAANIGLALQSNYAALLVLRCIQSSGSSGTIALSNAVVADICTTSERGKYIGYVTAGALLGPAVGPVIGGVLSQFLGWRAVFWFLTILAVVFFIPFLLFVPETCRKVVGNGSVPPPRWNMTLISYQRLRKNPSSEKPPQGKPVSFQLLNPLATLRILFDKEAGLVLFYAGIVFAGFYAVTAAVASQFNAIYHYNDLQVGLCFIPVGVGSGLSALTQGRFTDKNYRRYSERLGLTITKNRQQSIKDFPIEKARIEVAMPQVYLACAIVIAYGWVLQAKTSVAGPIVLLFFIGYSVSSSFNVISTLMIDVYPEAPSTATAAMNLARCLLGAGATAVVVPMVNSIGNGWTYTFIGLLWFLFSPMLWVVMRWGMGWRREKLERLEQRQREKEEKRRVTGDVV